LSGGGGLGIPVGWWQWRRGKEGTGEAVEVEGGRRADHVASILRQLASIFGCSGPAALDHAKLRAQPRRQRTLALPLFDLITVNRSFDQSKKNVDRSHAAGGP
jgi:hypothetical protein